MKHTTSTLFFNKLDMSAARVAAAEMTSRMVDTGF